MRKIIVLAAVLFFFSACKKEKEVTPFTADIFFVEPYSFAENNGQADIVRVAYLPKEKIHNVDFNNVRISDGIYKGEYLLADDRIWCLDADVYFFNMYCKYKGPQMKEGAVTFY